MAVKTPATRRKRRTAAEIQANKNRAAAEKQAKVNAAAANKLQLEKIPVKIDTTVTQTKAESVVQLFQAKKKQTASAYGKSLSSDGEEFDFNDISSGPDTPDLTLAQGINAEDSNGNSSESELTAPVKTKMSYI